MRYYELKKDNWIKEEDVEKLIPDYLEAVQNQCRYFEADSDVDATNLIYTIQDIESYKTLDELAKNSDDCLVWYYDWQFAKEPIIFDIFNFTSARVDEDKIIKI